MVIKRVTCILERDARILLAKLRNRDPLIKRMIWTFPYIKQKEGESPRIEVKRLFKKIDVNAKTGKFLIKHKPSENPKIEQLFYSVKYLSGTPKPTERFSKFIWIKPTQVLKYLTTSISPDIMDYLRSLEDTGKGLIIK